MHTGRRLRAEWIVGYALMVVAGGVLLSTWVAVSASRFVSDQLSYIVSGGIGGLVVLGLGAGLVVLAGLSDEWRTVNRLQDTLREHGGFAAPAAEEGRDPAVLVHRGRIVAGLGLLVAVAFVVPAWFRISGKPDLKPGLEALTWAVVGLVIGGLIAALATLRVQRRIQGQKRRLFALWTAAVAGSSAGTEPEHVRELAEQVLTAPGLTRFHRPGCAALACLAVRPIERGDIPAALEPCELCEADAIPREERTWTSVAG